MLILWLFKEMTLFPVLFLGSTIGYLCRRSNVTIRGNRINSPKNALAVFIHSDWQHYSFNATAICIFVPLTYYFLSALLESKGISNSQIPNIILAILVLSVIIEELTILPFLERFCFRIGISGVVCAFMMMTSVILVYTFRETKDYIRLFLGMLFFIILLLDKNVCHKMGGITGIIFTDTVLLLLKSQLI